MKNFKVIKYPISHMWRAYMKISQKFKRAVRSRQFKYPPVPFCSLTSSFFPLKRSRKKEKKENEEERGISNEISLESELPPLSSPKLLNRSRLQALQTLWFRFLVEENPRSQPPPISPGSDEGLRSQRSGQLSDRWYQEVPRSLPLRGPQGGRSFEDKDRQAIQGSFCESLIFFSIL